MDFLPINEFSFWAILIPGFITVWTFRYFAKLQKNGDFEFLGLGIICGLFNFLFLGILQKLGLQLPESSDPYSIALILSLFSFFLGFFTAQVTYWSWFKKVMGALRKNWFI